VVGEEQFGEIEGLQYAILDLEDFA